MKYKTHIRFKEDNKILETKEFETERQLDYFHNYFMFQGNTEVFYLDDEVEE